MHIFRIEGDPKDVTLTASGLNPMRLIGGLLGKGVAKRVTDTLQPHRDCATIRLPAAMTGGAAGGGGGGGAGAMLGIGGVCALRDQPESGMFGGRRGDAEDFSGAAALGAGASAAVDDSDNRGGGGGGGVSGGFYEGVGGTGGSGGGAGHSHSPAGRVTGVQVVAVNADGLMCEYGVDLETGASSLERECSLADEDGGGFGANGTRAAAAGARWIGGGDVNGGGGGGGGGSGGAGQVDLSASLSMSMGQSMFMART